MQQTSLRFGTIVCGFLVVLGLAFAPLVAPDLSVGAAMAQQATYTCTEVIGFSQTDQWYEGGFIQSIPNPGNWQLRWFSGGSIDQWAAGGGNYRSSGFPGWDPQYLVTHCAQNSGSPDRVVLQVSGDFHNDPNWWAQQTGWAIANIRNYAPNERQISLMPVVGGPNGGQCFDSSGNVVRASYNFPYINQGLQMDVGREVVLGPRPTVRTCADYADNTGHLVPAARQAIGASIAQFYASGAAAPSPGQPTSTPTPTMTPTQPPATSTPTPTRTPTAVPPTATNTPTSTSIQAASCPCSIFSGSAQPNVSAPGNGGDANSVEVGVRFRADTNGFVSGIRFYKLSVNTGAHTGSLWTNSGTLLATATFSAETASGWQQVNFSSPVAVTANTTYVASYHTDGRYAADQNYFSSGGVDNPPLHALASGVDGGDGAYRYGPTTVFPSGSYQGSNYWVDVVYTQSAGPTSTPTPTLTPTPTPTNTALPRAGGTTITFDDRPSSQPLSGQYAGAEWGTNSWRVSAPWGQFNTNSLTFFNENYNNASFTFLTPRTLVSLDAFNGANSPSTISLSCAGQPTRAVTVPGNQMVTIAANWSGTCTTISVSSSNGWWTNFDNIVYR